MSTSKKSIKQQLSISVEAHEKLQQVFKEANKDFKIGFVTLSECVSHAILNAKFDYTELRRRNINAQKLIANVYSANKDDSLPLVEVLLKYQAEQEAKKQRAEKSKGNKEQSS